MSGPNEQRARLLRRRAPLLRGIFLSILVGLSFLICLSSGVALFVTRNKEYGIYFLVALGVLVVARVARYLTTRSCTCPLCHGQWMVEPKCRTHDKARRYLLFKFRTSLIIDAIFRWSFRCPYCGTPFRLKP